jgi:hypothetical protein
MSLARFPGTAGMHFHQTLFPQVTTHNIILKGKPEVISRKAVGLSLYSVAVIIPTDFGFNHP